MYWRAEEESSIAVLYRYSKKNPSARLRFIYPDDEEYVFVFDSAFEGDNQDDVDAGLSSDVEDFFVIGYLVEDVIREGLHGFQKSEYIDIDYRDLPLIVTTEDGIVVYSTTTEASQTED